MKNLIINNHYQYSKTKTLCSLHKLQQQQQCPTFYSTSVPFCSAVFISLSLKCWTERAKLVTWQVATTESKIDRYIQGFQNEGSFGGSHREVPFKWWNHSFGWHHKPQQKMQRHSCSCHLCSFLDFHDCQLQLCFQPREPIKVRFSKIAALCDCALC